jgi:hypothetical protein
MGGGSSPNAGRVRTLVAALDGHLHKLAQLGGKRVAATSTTTTPEENRVRDLRIEGDVDAGHLLWPRSHMVGALPVEWTRRDSSLLFWAKAARATSILGRLIVPALLLIFCFYLCIVYFIFYCANVVFSLFGDQQRARVGGDRLRHSFMSTPPQGAPPHNTTPGGRVLLQPRPVPVMHDPRVGCSSGGLPVLAVDGRCVWPSGREHERRGLSCGVARRRWRLKLSSRRVKWLRFRWSMQEFSRPMVPLT